MRRLYVIIPGIELATRLCQTLLAEGVDGKAMRMFAARRHRSSASSIPLQQFRPALSGLLLSGLAGSAVFLAIGWMLSPSTGLALVQGIALPITAALGFLLAAGVRWLSGPPRELKRLIQEMGDDDILLIMDVPDHQCRVLSQKILAEHPEIRVLGSDPAGSPPFP